MARFDSALALAARLILKNGEVAAFRKPTNAALPDANYPFELGAPAAPVDTAVSAVFLDHLTARELGWTVSENQQIALVAGTSLDGVTPDISRDQIVRADGEEWSVVDFSLLNPNGQKILYVFTLQH
jgi:hypothetical protein